MVSTSLNQAVLRCRFRFSLANDEGGCNANQYGAYNIVCEFEQHPVWRGDEEVSVIAGNGNSC